MKEGSVAGGGGVGARLGRFRHWESRLVRTGIGMEAGVEELGVEGSV